jgi:two-component system, response regulator FlrC
MILLVEDNKISREAFAKILRLHGHQVTEANNATQGLDILGDIRCDLVITDFVMPDMSGFQLIAQIREKWPHTPILLMSGYLTPEIGDIISDGIDFIPKPVEVPVLLEAIERLVHGQ